MRWNLLSTVGVDNGPVDYLPVFFVLLLAVGLGVGYQL